jgi:DNA-binding winged helix-turn-helix (wHTH) protein
MKPIQPLQFDAYRLDPQNERLWHAEEAIPLTPKAFTLLLYLANHPGQLLTKEQLLKAVWEDTLVSDAALTVCIREIRKALHDEPRAPRFIETVHRRGYRFIAAVTVAPTDEKATPEATTPHTPVAGREVDVAKLQAALDGMRSALDGLAHALTDTEPILELDEPHGQGGSHIQRAAHRKSKAAGDWSEAG